MPQNCDIATLPVEMINNLSHFSFQPNTRHAVKDNSYWILYFVNQGSLHLTFSDRELYLQKNQGFFVEKDLPHHFLTDLEETSEVTIIGLSLSEVEIFKLLCEEPLDFSTQQRQTIEQILNESQFVYPQLTTNVFNTSTKLEDVDYVSLWLLPILLSELLLTLTKTQKKSSGTKNSPLLDPGYKNNLVNEIIDYLEDNLDQNFSIDDLAAHFYISPSYLKKVFKKYTGYSIINFFRTMKMKKAKELIKEQDLNVTDIGLLLGYESVHHFSNTFKKYTGMSPSNYKKSISVIEEKLDQLN